MTKVFVPNKTEHDYSDAERFGQIVFLSEGHLRRNDMVGHREIMSKAIVNSSSMDYIVITGLSVMSAVAAAMFAAKHGKLNLLLWDHGQYHDCKFKMLVSG